MPVTIDEVTAEITAPASQTPPAASAESKASSTVSESRRQREHFERMLQRAARVAAN